MWDKGSARRRRRSGTQDRLRLSVIFWIAGGLALGQGPGSPRFRVGPVYTTGFPNLDIVLEASAGGTTPASINASDLILTEEGVRTSAAQGLRKFSETGQGVAVLLALDASGSMKGKPLDAVRKGLAQFVSKARDNDKIGVLSFADDARWESQWSGTREETRQKLQGIQTRGHTTVLWDALELALDELAKVDGPARRHLVVISDGHDEGSEKTLADVISKAASLSIPVDSIGLTRSDARYLENLKALSDQSKGSYSPAPDLDALTQLVGSSIDQLLASPVARFRAEKLTADGGTHRVGVYWKAADKQDETSVAMPTGQQTGPNQRGQQSNEPQSNQKFRWWYGAIAGGVVAIALVLWVVLRKRQPAVALPPPEPIPQFAPWPEPSRSTFTEQESAPPRPDLPPPISLPPLPKADSGVQTPPVERPRARTQYAAGFRPPALLIGKSGPIAGKTVRIDRADFWVGAAENNNLRLDDETVSGNHAFFRFEADNLKIFDNHSTNDTWVNRQAVGGTAKILFPGDEIQIGRSVFVVERPQETSPQNFAQPGPPFALS